MARSDERGKYWRLYRTPAGNAVVKDALRAVAAKSLSDYATIRAAMNEVERDGIRGTKQLDGEIRQIEADGDHGVTYRLLFAVDGHSSQICLGLVLLNKKTQKTPKAAIDLAKDRLKTWRANAPPRFDGSYR